MQPVLIKYYILYDNWRRVPTLNATAIGFTKIAKPALPMAFIFKVKFSKLEASTRYNRQIIEG